MVRSVNLLKVEGLKVEVAGKEVIHGVDLHLPKGEVHALMGPNGSGKSTLIMTIMGFEKYKVTEGRVLFRGRDITHMPVYERARMGIGLAFQRPPVVRGINIRQLVEMCAMGRDVDVESIAFDMNFTDFLDRDVNLGFSGGEMKRSELVQLMAQRPSLVLLDEPESGVDLESISLLGKAINRLLERYLEPKGGESLKEAKEKRDRSALVITHTGHILDFVAADRGHVLINGHIVCSGNPKEILMTVEKFGYEECARCLR